MTGKPGVLQSMGSQRVGHNLATEQQQQQHTHCGGNGRESKDSDKIVFNKKILAPAHTHTLSSPKLH